MEYDLSYIDSSEKKECIAKVMDRAISTINRYCPIGDACLSIKNMLFRFISAEIESGYNRIVSSYYWDEREYGIDKISFELVLGAILKNIKIIEDATVKMKVKNLANAMIKDRLDEVKITTVEYNALLHIIDMK